MSVNTWYQCVTPEKLNELLVLSESDPKAFGNYLCPEDYDEDEDEENPLELSEPHLWTEKNWYLLDLLFRVTKLEEQPWLLASISGGTPVGDGYCYEDEPVRYLRPEEIPPIAEALQTVEADELRKDFEPEIFRVNGYYFGEGWTNEDFPYIWNTFCAIRDFFAMTSKEGYALLIYIC